MSLDERDYMIERRKRLRGIGEFRESDTIETFQQPDIDVDYCKRTSTGQEKGCFRLEEYICQVQPAGVVNIRRD